MKPNHHANLRHHSSLRNAFAQLKTQPSQSAEKPTDEVRRFVACPEMTGQEMTGQDKYGTSFHNPERFYEKVVKPYGPKLDPESAENPAQSIGRKPGRSSSTEGQSPETAENSEKQGVLLNSEHIAGQIVGRLL